FLAQNCFPAKALLIEKRAQKLRSRQTFPVGFQKSRPSSVSIPLRSRLDAVLTEGHWRSCRTRPHVRTPLCKFNIFAATLESRPAELHRSPDLHVPGSTNLDLQTSAENRVDGLKLIAIMRAPWRR